MLKMNNIALKELLMEKRYDDLFGSDHELYTVYENYIEFSIDAPTDLGEGDVFILRVKDAEVNKSSKDPLEYYEERVSEFRDKLITKYVKKIKPKIDKMFEVACQSLRKQLPSKVKGFIKEAYFTDQYFVAKFRFSHKTSCRTRVKKAQMIVSINDLATTESVQREMSVWVASVAEKLNEWVSKV